VTADEIEFFVPDDPPPDGEWHTEEMGGRPRTRRRLELGRNTAAAVLLLAGAAALPAVASFQGVYRITEGNGRRSEVNFGADGWGRYRQDDSTLAPPSGIHEGRYGIALMACAAVLALLAVAVLAARLPGPLRRFDGRVRRVTVVVALTASAVLGGVSAAIALHIQSMFDSLRAQLSSFDGGFGPEPTVETGVGACLWLALAGAVAGLLAAGVLFRSRHTDVPD
jgi:hypothetical protein